MRQASRHAVITALLLVLTPLVASAQDRGAGLTSRGLRPASTIAHPPRQQRPPGTVGGPHRRPPGSITGTLPVFPCCLDTAYAPVASPTTIVPAVPPPIYVVVPSPLALAYVPPPRPEPAPEIILPSGRWARHGNGVDYPYVWVWAGPAPGR
jgi:hypothetical protein